MRLSFSLFAGLGLALNLGIGIPAAFAAEMTPPTPAAVTLWNTQQKNLFSNAVAADLGGDGIAEIITGAGFGDKPLVTAYRQDGSSIFSFLAYGESFHGGVNVAVCDLQGDGGITFVTGAGFSGGPHIRMFDTTGTFTGTQFFAYDMGFRGGVSVACGDIDGNGTDEIITASGMTGGPHVRAFDASGKMLSEIFAGSATENTGANITVTDIDGDAKVEILVTPIGPTTPSLTVLDYKQGKLVFERSWPIGTSVSSGISVIAANVQGDARKEILATGGLQDPGTIFIWNAEGMPLPSQKINTTALATLVTLPERVLALPVASALGGATAGKHIVVDISEQRLTAYENGIPFTTFLVSTGKPGYYTPRGETTVLAKLPVYDYVWNYGAGDPRNYALRGVKWNLRVFPHIYIHSAYWHNNFGTPVSHGCINARTSDAEIIFNWADVGTAVTVQE